MKCPVIYTDERELNTQNDVRILTDHGDRASSSPAVLDGNGYIRTGCWATVSAVMYGRFPVFEAAFSRWSIEC